MTDVTFLDCSGVGNSGKAAVVDFLREVDGVYAPDYWFELDIIRVADGLLDLRHCLLEDWSPIRSHHGIRAFLDVVDRMGPNPSPWDIVGLMRSTSQRYDRTFDGRFTPVAKAFANSFVRARYKSYWPFNMLYISPSRNFAWKVLRKLKVRSIYEEDVLIADGMNFDDRATEFLLALYRPLLQPDTRYVVLNNGFEPFNPIPGLDMLRGSKQIIVTRDPRDIYVSGQNVDDLALDDRHLATGEKNYGMHSTFLATNDLDIYVERQRVYHRNAYKGADPRVLRIRFEDMVCDYTSTAAKILDFLGIGSDRHKSAKRHFDPDRSGRNVGIWKKFSWQDEIAYIAAQLPDLLVDI